MVRECNKTYTDTYNCHIGFVKIKTDECNGKVICSSECSFLCYDYRNTTNRCALFNKYLSNSERCMECINSNLTIVELDTTESKTDNLECDAVLEK